MLNVSQHSQENIFSGVSFLINLAAACKKKSLFQKGFTTSAFLTSEICYNNFFKEKKGIVLRIKALLQETWIRYLSQI